MNDPTNEPVDTSPNQKPEAPAEENQAPAPEGLPAQPDDGDTTKGETAALAPRPRAAGPDVGDKIRYGINSTVWAAAIVTARRTDGLLSLTVFAEGETLYRTEVAEADPQHGSTERWF